MKIGGSIALVTGASSGIGEATAARLALAGYKVYGTSRRIQAGQRSFAMLPLDVTSDESVEAAVGEVVRLDGRIDLLVNNAGFSIAPAGATVKPALFTSRSMRPSLRITSATAAVTDSSLVTSSASISNDRSPARAARLLVP